MKYYLFLISKEELKNGDCGWKYIKEHEDRLIEYKPNVGSDFVGFLTTMERDVFHVVKDDVVYSTYKNYLDLTNNRRIYIMVNKGYSSDVV